LQRKPKDSIHKRCEIKTEMEFQALRKISGVVLL